MSYGAIEILLLLLLLLLLILLLLLLLSTRGYTSSVGVQHGNKHSHWIYKLRGSPAWKQTFTQEDIKVRCGSSINISRYTSSVGVQHGKHTFTLDIQAPWESSMETCIHTREYTHRRRLGPDFWGNRSRIIRPYRPTL